MALEMKATSNWWYARFLVNRKLRRFPLMEIKDGQEQRIEIKGRRPPSLKHPEKGDAAFQESHRRARAAHDRLMEEELSKKSVGDLTQRVIEARTGARIEFLKVKDIPDAWAAIPRKRQPSKQYIDTAKGTLKRFADFMCRHHSETEDMATVRAEHIKAFMDTETARGISPRTWNISQQLLKTVFRRLEPNADAFRSFLKNAAFKDEDTVHRAPFKDDELDVIIESARADDVLYGPMVTALCTAMRRGDCCLLKWASVDMNAGFIEIRTSKTGETAEIPILPMLRDVLSCTPRTKSEYIFPQAAELYQKDHHSLDRRLRAILTRAGFVDVKPVEEAGQEKQGKPEAGPTLPELPPDERRRQGLQAIKSGTMTEPKRERMKTIFTAYMDSKSLPTIARELNFSKSTVFLHLREIEDMIGAAVIRRRTPRLGPVLVRGAIHAEKGDGKRLKRGSIRGWHSFRAAFVTRALGAGMPEELVRRVTGHTAVDVMRRHYFRPGREEFRREFEKAMPQLMMNGAKSRDEQLREIIEKVTPKTLKKDKARLLAI